MGGPLAWGGGVQLPAHTPPPRKGKIMHKYPQNQSTEGSTGQTITTNVSMTPCNWQIWALGRFGQHGSSTQPTPVPLPIQGLWGGGATRTSPATWQEPRPQRWRLCLTQPAPILLPIQGLWGVLHRFRKHRSTPTQMLQALQHSFSAAASIAALLRCRTVAVLELQLLHCSLTQSAPVPLPIQGLWGGAASYCTRGTAGPRAAELSIAAWRHRCGVPGLRVVAAGAKPRHHRGPAQEGQYTGVVGGQPHGCPQQQPPHGGAQGRRAVHSRPASQLRGSQAQADHTACQKNSRWAPSHGDLKRAMSIYGHEAGGMGPWSHRTLFQSAPAHFPQPLPKPPHGGTVLCMVTARAMREATESGGCFCIPSAPAARPLGNVRCHV